MDSSNRPHRDLLVKSNFRVGWGVFDGKAYSRAAYFKVWHYLKVRLISSLTLKNDIIFSINLVKQLQKGYFANEIYQPIAISSQSS